MNSAAWQSAKPCDAQLPATAAETACAQRAVSAFVANRLCVATPRSDAYLAGYCAQLLWFAQGAPKGIGAGHPPFTVGTSDADAWWSGWDAAANPRVRADWVTALEQQSKLPEAP